MVIWSQILLTNRISDRVVSANSWQIRYTGLSGQEKTGEIISVDKNFKDVGGKKGWLAGWVRYYLSYNFISEKPREIS